VVTLVGGLLPSARSGTVSRSMLGLVAALRGAGLVDTGTARAGVLAFALVPGLAVAAVVAAAVGWRRATGTLSVMTGLVGGGGAVAVAVSPLRAEFGVVVALVGAIVATAAGGHEMVRGRVGDD
jgi:hypothetical protein